MQLHLPLGMALLVAPTPSVRSDSSVLGRAFLTADDSAGLIEYVLVLSRLYRLNAKAAPQQFESALQREQQQLTQPESAAAAAIRLRGGVKGSVGGFGRIYERGRSQSQAPTEAGGLLQARRLQFEPRVLAHEAAGVVVEDLVRFLL